MIKRMIEAYRNYRKQQVLKEWGYNDALRRQYYAELLYHTWISGYLSGFGGGDPVEAWAGQLKLLQIDYPIRPEVVELYDNRKKKEVANG